MLYISHNEDITSLCIHTNTHTLTNKPNEQTMIAYISYLHNVIIEYPPFLCSHVMGHVIRGKGYGGRRGMVGACGCGL